MKLDQHRKVKMFLLTGALLGAFSCGPTEPEPWDFDLELFTEFVGAMRHAGNGISCEFIQNNR